MLLQRLDQQPLGILWRNAIIVDRYIGNRNINVRLGFLGNIDVGLDPEGAEQEQSEKNRTGARESGADHRIHEADPISRRTSSPDSTNA